MPITQVEKIWMDGELVDWADAKIHVLSHALHYGTGVFEGIRAYETARGPAVWHLDEHLRRLYRSAKLYHLDIPFAVDAVREGMKDVIRTQADGYVYAPRGPGLGVEVDWNAMDAATIHRFDTAGGERSASAGR